MPTTYKQSDFTVYIKWTWSAPWCYVDYLYPLQLTWSVAPEMPRATLEFDYGRIKKAGLTTKNLYSPLDLTGCYVKIQSNDEFITWAGVITDESTGHHGISAAAKAGTQIYTAYGLEHLLARAPIDHALIDYGESTHQVDVMPTFNLRSATGGTVLGNRATAMIDDDFSFSSDGALWTYFDIIDYIIHEFAPSQIIWTPNGEITDLTGPGMYPVIDLNGLTVYDALNKLIDRRRGYFWYALYADGDNAVHIQITNIFPANVTAGGITLSKNPNFTTLDIRTDRQVEVAVTHESKACAYDTVRVVGEPVKSCFTVWFGERGRLEAGWSEAEETAYKAGVSADLAGYADLTEDKKAEVNDRYRLTDKFPRVYSFFRIPTDFDWQVINSSFISYHLANPTIDESDGSITAVAGNYFNANKRILTALPLQEGLDYSVDGYTSQNPSGAEPSFRPILALIQNADGKWCLATESDEHGVAGAQVRAATREMGVWIKFKPPHRLAANNWANFEPTNHEADYDYTSLALTVCVSTDEHLAVKRTIGWAAESFGDLVIRVPGAECWYVAEDTIVGVDPDGELQRIFAGPAVLRNDAARLNVIADLAQEWYQTDRRALTLKKTPCQNIVSLGYLITEITTGTGETITLNSVVTRQTMNLAAQTSEITTDWWDVDFNSIAPINLTGLATPKQMHAETQLTAARASDLANWGGE